MRNRLFTTTLGQLRASGKAEAEASYLGFLTAKVLRANPARYTSVHV